MQSTPVSVLLCRIGSVLGAIAFLAMLLIGVAAFPPLLDRLMVDGGVSSVPIRIGLGLISLLMVAGGGAGVWRMAVLWGRATRVAARPVQLAALTLSLVAIVSLGFLEFAARVAVPVDGLLSGDAYWHHLWRESRAARAETGGAPFGSARFDAELGWAPRDGYRSPEVNINSRGARGIAEDEIPKLDGQQRIVVFGDSFTFGEGVRDDETYPAQLEDILDVGVVNLGVLGYGVDQQYLRLRRDAFAYDPVLVVLGIFGPDVDRNTLSFRDAAKPRFVLQDEGIRLVNSPVPPPTEEVPDPLPTFRGFAWLNTIALRYLDRTTLAPKWEITRRILDAIADECANAGVPLLVAFFPAKPIAFNHNAADAENVVQRWAEQRGVDFYSIRPAFSRMPMERRDEIFLGHWTPSGNRFVAELLAEEIQARGYLRTDPR